MKQESNPFSSESIFLGSSIPIKQVSTLVIPQDVSIYSLFVHGIQAHLVFLPQNFDERRSST